MGDRVLAVDLGGTRMRAAVVGPDGTVVDRRVRPTPRDEPCPDALLGLVGDVLAGHAVGSAVVAVPGLVDHARGALEHAPNLPPHWPGALREEHLSGHLGVPVALANDADVATVGEARFGAGRGHDDVVYVTLSTGVGAGVVLGGRLLHGRRSLAELGHTILDLTAWRAGNPATVEERASGTALGAAGADRGLPSSGSAVAELVREGEPAAVAAWNEAVAAVTATAVNAVHLFSPEVLVLGGGMGRDPYLLEPVRAAIDRHTVRGGYRAVVRTAELGDDAGLVGGAGWSRAMREVA